VAVPKTWAIAVVVVLVVVVAVGSLWGDLTDSLIKRAFPSSSAGSLVLGYGGVLDRVDSLLMAFPLCYYAVVLTQRLSN
jgi:phosphatidate cytidylyltransferase